MNPYNQNYSSEGTTQLSAKINEEMHSDFKEMCASHGKSMTDEIEELIAQRLDESGYSPETDTQLPENQKQSKALKALREHATKAGVPREIAESVVAERCGIKKKFVRRALLNPLRKAGWIRFEYGRIAVSMPTDTAGAELTNDTQTVNEKLDEITTEAEATT